MKQIIRATAMGFRDDTDEGSSAVGGAAIALAALPAFGIALGRDADRRVETTATALESVFDRLPMGVHR